MANPQENTPDEKVFEAHKARLNKLYWSAELQDDGESYASVTCLHCGAVAHTVQNMYKALIPGFKLILRRFECPKCKHLNLLHSLTSPDGMQSGWGLKNQGPLHPAQSTLATSADVPVAPSALPSECAALWNEAASVLDVSARSALALLRGCLERLLTSAYPEIKDEKLATKIDKVSESQLLERAAQFAMHILREKGNEAVHADDRTFIDLESSAGEQREDAVLAFSIIAQICEATIGMRLRVEESAGRLPSETLDRIEHRMQKSVGRRRAESPE